MCLHYVYITLVSFMLKWIEVPNLQVTDEKNTSAEENRPKTLSACRNNNIALFLQGLVAYNYSNQAGVLYFQ